jgi:SNF2 family DNA or RNA helicase
MTTTYGTLTYKADDRIAKWGIQALPHVMIRIKRLFPQVASYATGLIQLSDTPEVARDIEWVAERYPLEMSEEVAEHLTKRADAHRERAQAIDAILSGHIDPLVPLASAGMTPRSHQEQFVALAQRVQRMLLADDLGLGKTISAGFLLGFEGALPALIVVPTHLPRHWVDKLSELWPLLRIHVIKQGSPYDFAKVRALKGQTPNVLIMGYSKLAGWGDALAGQANTVIFDEVQELRHGQGTQKGMAAAQVARGAQTVIGLSATPVFNYGSEIHNIMQILSPDALGSREEFLREWGGGGSNGHEHVKNPAALGTYLRDSGLLLRRTRQDIHQDMPEPFIMEETVETDQSALDEVAGDVAAMARMILSNTADKKDRFIAAGNLDWRLRQATGIAKAPYVAEFVRLLLESTDRIVLWGWHRAVYELWMERLAEFNPVLYTGSESATQKNAAYDAFRSPLYGHSRILIMSLRSGAGIDGLQDVCNVGVFGELDWSPEQHKQCIGRLDRDGQKTTPAIYYLTADEGSDPVISEVLQIKRQQAEPIRDPSKPLFEKTISTDNRMRLLAESTLKRLGQQELTA